MVIVSLCLPWDGSMFTNIENKIKLRDWSVSVSVLLSLAEFPRK